MRKVIFYMVLLISTSSYSQKRLSQAAINDLVNRASSYLGIEQNDKFRSAVNKYLSIYNSSGAAAVMSNLRTDLKGKEDILNFINRASGSRESLLRTLTAMNVNPKNVQEITDYLFPKPVSQKAVVEKPVPDELSVKDAPSPEELSVKEILKPIVWIPPSKIFFDGTKTFCDSSGKWYYTVTIIQSNVLLIKYPGQPNIKEDKRTPVVETKAVINGDNIVSARNYPSNYKYENNMFYERGEEGDKWNKYVECASE